jgi:hypothetical protein
MKSTFLAFAVLTFFSSRSICETFRNDLISFEAPQGVQVEEYDIFLPQPFYNPRTPKTDIKWYVFPRDKNWKENSTLLGRAEHYAMSTFYAADGADGGTHGKAVLVDSLKSADGNDVLLFKVHVVGFGESKHQTGLLLGYLLAVDTKKVTKQSFYTAFFYSEDLETLRAVARTIRLADALQEDVSEPAKASMPSHQKVSQKVQIDYDAPPNNIPPLLERWEPVKKKINAPVDLEQKNSADHKEVSKVTNTKALILIPYISEGTEQYIGENWFAVPVSPLNSREVVKGKVTLVDSKIEGLGLEAIFTKPDSTELKGNFFNYVYIRNFSGLREGAFNKVEGLDCLHKIEIKKPITCVLNLNSQKITITEEYLRFDDRANAPTREFKLSLNGQHKLTIKSQKLAIAGDINHDGRIDLIFIDSDVSTTTDIYSVSPDGKEFELIASATSGGC